MIWMCSINVVGGSRGGSVECGVPYRSFAVFSTGHSDLHLPKVTVFVQPVLFMRGVIVNYNLGDVIIRTVGKHICGI